MRQSDLPFFIFALVVFAVWVFIDLTTPDTSNTIYGCPTLHLDDCSFDENDEISCNKQVWIDRCDKQSPHYLPPENDH